MALQKTITTPYGIEVPDAYFRVEYVRVTSKTSIQFNVYGYADPSKQFIVESLESCAYDLNGDNPIKQAYAYLKTLPEFEGAIDC